jgi:hypothetical protein
MYQRGKSSAHVSALRGSITLAALWCSTASSALGQTLELAPPASFSVTDSDGILFGPSEPYAQRRAHGRFALDGQTNGPALTPAPDEAAPSLLFTADETFDRRIHFEAKDLAVDYGTLEISLDAVSQAASDTLSVDRLVLASGFEEDAVSAVVAGWKLQLLERFTLGSRAALSDRRSDSSTAFRSADALAVAAQGDAMWSDFTAKLIDDPGLRWSLSGQLGLVDPDFRAPAGARPRGSPAVAGTRTYLMTRLDADGAALSAAVQRIDGPTRDLETRRATLDLEGMQFTVYGSDLADALSATNTLGVTAEIYGEDLVPASWGALKVWAPTLLSVSLERSKTLELEPGAGPPTQGPSLSVEAAWATDWGQTSLSYWQSDATSGAPSGTIEASRFIDVSHLVTFGDWRTSFGASFDAFFSRADGEESADSGFSGHASFSYAAKDRPELKFGVDRRQDETMIDADITPWRSTALDLFFSVDFAPWLKSNLGVAPTRAGVEYRRQLRGDVAAATEAPTVTEAFVASFAAPL